MTAFQCTHVLTLDYYMREKGYFSSDHWFLGTRGYYSVDFNLRHKIWLRIHLLFYPYTQVPPAQLCNHTANFYQVSIKRLANHLQDSVSLPRNNCILKGELGFPGGSVVKNLLVSAGDTGLIPDPGRSHMPRSTNPRSHSYLACALEPQLLSSHASSPEAQAPWNPRLATREAAAMRSLHMATRE